MLTTHKSEINHEIHIYSNLESIADNYKAVLLDAHGVFWGGNGIGLLPGCRATMDSLVKKGKTVGVLSNTTQIARNEIEKLKAHGLIEGVHFHFFLTSGEVSKRMFLESELPFPTSKKKYYLFGKVHPKFSSHHTIFEGSSFQETSNLKDADFIYISIPHINGVDQTDPSLFLEDLDKIMHAQLPMLCTNPDQYAQEGNPAKAVVRQGIIAVMYESLGGKVYYIGKPSKGMFQAAMEKFNHYEISNPGDVLMVGDTPETDVRGAKKFGMPSALVLKTGIMAERISKMGLKSILEVLSADDYPNYFIESMGKNEL
ncbi:MAG: TIGR01459 family HAD-type hydrolase [Parachlamydiaceae bacterium]|nr:TIGR01459 family HAD-type hydrolase [Parachlamydiaceae bacterium]